MPNISTPGARVTPIPSGVIARAVQAARYVITGVTPQTWFGPMQPLKPFAPEGTGGRAFDYPVGYNLQYQPRYNEPISFADLHALANNCDMLGIIIESRKDQIEGQEWEVRPRKLADGTHPKASAFAAQIKQAKDFFAYPDKECALPQWLRTIAHEVFVTDAPSIYVRPDRKGRVYGFEVLDGSTISPRIDAWGRTPAAPDVAYQQILHGVPAADFSRDQLIYFPRNKRPGHVYGYSPVEQVILTANTLIRREMHQLAFYTDGNLTDGIFTSPMGWTKDQIISWQQYWDSQFLGNVAARRSGQWVPSGVDYKALKPPVLKDPYDEFLARIVCFAFKVSPQPFVSMMNRATADTAHDAAIEEGLLPFLNWFEDLFRRLFDILGWTDIEMVTVDDRETDPQVSAAIDVADVKAGVRTINEVRSGRGLDPIHGGDIPMVETATGYVDIRANLQPEDGGPEPKPQPTTGVKPGEGPGYDESGEQPAKIARFHKRKHGKIARKLPPVKQGAVADGAKAAIAERFATALAKAGKSAAKQVRAALAKNEDDPDKRALEIAVAIELDLEAAGDDSASDLAAVMAAAAQGQLAQLGLGTADGMFGVVNARAVKAAAAQAAQLVSQIDESTRSALRDLIANGLANGNSIDEIAGSIANMKVGNSSAFGEDRAALIAKTEVADANSRGALDALKVANDNGVKAKKTWLLGPDPCEVCQENADAGAIDVNDDFPSGDSEPTAHCNCLPAYVNVLADGVRAASKRWFNGDIVIIRTAGGNELSCTPNHPILSDGGFVAAQGLNVGDYVISGCVSERIAARADMHDQNVPASIEDVAETFGRSVHRAATPVPASAKDFHGDARDGDVAIVWADSRLVARVEAAFAKRVAKKLVERTDAQLALHDGLRALQLLRQRVLTATNGFMSRARAIGTAFLADLCHVQPHGFALAAGSAAIFDQVHGHGGALDSERKGNSLDGLARVKPATDFGDIDRLAPPEALQGARQTATPNMGADRVNRDAILAREIIEGRAGPVARDEIISIRRVPFAGHVFNIETRDSWYIAGGIVTHNCECALGAEVEEAAGAGESDLADAA